MPDVLDPLRGLARSSMSEPEPVEALRARTARRRRRQRWLVVPVAAVGLVAAGLVATTAIDDDPDREVVTADDPTTSTAPTTSSAATTSVPDAPTGVAGLRRVVSGPGGVTVIDPVATPPERRLTDAPSRLAFGVGDALVVAQRVEPSTGTASAIVVVDGGVERVLLEQPVVGLGHYLLHDAGTVEGRPVAVISAAGGTEPADWAVHLLLVDLLTGVQRDLGVTGGWEDGIASAHLLDGGDVVFEQAWIHGGALERRGLDGTTRWETTALDGDRVRTTVVLGEQALVLEPSWDGAGHHLLVRRFDVATGDERPPSQVTLHGDDLGQLDGVCGHLAQPAPDGVLCTRSHEGGPVLVDPSDGRTVPTGDGDGEPRSIVTLWR